jgi:hypothetical protein
MEDGGPEEEKKAKKGRETVIKQNHEGTLPSARPSRAPRNRSRALPGPRTATWCFLSSDPTGVRRGGRDSNGRPPGRAVRVAAAKKQVKGGTSSAATRGTSPVRQSRAPVFFCTRPSSSLSLCL